MNQYYSRRSPSRRLFTLGRLAIVSFAAIPVCGLSGCAGLNSIPQSLGINSASRVPPPGTGSFAVPNPYTNGIGANSSTPMPSTTPTSTPLSQANPIAQPTSQVLSSINRVQSRLHDTAGQVQDSVNRATSEFQSTVERTGANVNRIGDGVVQAGAIISESLSDATQPTQRSPSQPVTHDPNVSWRNPSSSVR